jgi:hypothetical protein
VIGYANRPHDEQVDHTPSGSRRNEVVRPQFAHVLTSLPAERTRPGGAASYSTFRYVGSDPSTCSF